MTRQRKCSTGSYRRPGANAGPRTRINELQRFRVLVPAWRPRRHPGRRKPAPVPGGFACGGQSRAADGTKLCTRCGSGFRVLLRSPGMTGWPPELGQAVSTRVRSPGGERLSLNQDFGCGPACRVGPSKPSAPQLPAPTPVSSAFHPGSAPLGSGTEHRAWPARCGDLTVCCERRSDHLSTVTLVSARICRIQPSGLVPDPGNPNAVAELA